ncbi:TetR/AcrR family transcriptional regulator [Parasedimentitalea maritima]|uniref:TetR/AcrR family transcriptional regulator n=1 Tax=Parasedimentitalea maritima TaxID=2578117 RepID=A0ABY2URS4_9RHOB|nr:TetR/AcrR family transcriptional regulator [Zongyanglinia marina]TLP58525.1 TetR/AcrR family transcriptional regulator [Zongyanglinia marina]
MPRPSLKDQRSVEILDAYLTCVARFGLEGATQERIAEQAGVKRPLLRHYLGNRDQMVAALCAHVVQVFDEMTDGADVALQQVNSLSGLVDLLFTEDGQQDARLLLAWQALSVAVGGQNKRRDMLLNSLERFLAVLTKTLQRLSPEAPLADCRAVAQGITSILVNLESLMALAPPQAWRDELHKSALILANSLEGQ